MSLVPLVTVIMVFAIPIFGIALAGYKEWLKFKAKHQKLGTSTREIEYRLEELQDRLAQLEDERDALRERVENLETIVTSEAWIAEHDETTDLPPLSEVGEELLEPPAAEDASSSDAEHTAELARRLRGR